MRETIITEDIKEFLQNQEFINIATADFAGLPSVAPKFLLKIEDDYIYLADYIMGKTYRNMKINPRVSLSTVNMDTLIGYQINGKAEIIEKGREYQSLIEQFRNKQIQFSVTRIIEGVHKEARHGIFETSLPERVAIFKIRAKEIVEIISTGELKRKRGAI
ncbi:MAG: pyridoxamine 5'-phosphate oxidase family protein [Candidatus Omnitrophota bacterium]|jgi:predicted pyridoxine 5'-phosphate oxidase superfamily flavin-nucleotide-binding protein